MADSSVTAPTAATALRSLAIAPRQVLRGCQAVPQAGAAIAQLGQRPLLVGGDRSLTVTQPSLEAALHPYDITLAAANYRPDCSENVLVALHAAARAHQADCIIGTGGGKSLDAAKLLAHQLSLPIVTIPTSAATCAGWTALSNIYSDDGAFQYDVGLASCPDLLILDYDLVAMAPRRTLVAGIGDAIAKWYEAAVSSGDSSETLIIAAVQQARVLRDILFQKSTAALDNPGSADWREVVDAAALLAGAIGGLGGAQCRTVAAHAVHNGLTHLPAAHHLLHGEKVAFGILVQLRLEEIVQGNQLAIAAREQLLKFYREIGLPATLDDLDLANLAIAELRRATEIACAPTSDIHHLPFAVTPELLLAAMVSTTAFQPARTTAAEG